MVGMVGMVVFRGGEIVELTALDEGTTVGGVGAGVELAQLVRVMVMVVVPDASPEGAGAEDAGPDGASPLIENWLE